MSMPVEATVTVRPLPHRLRHRDSAPVTPLHPDQPVPAGEELGPLAGAIGRGVVEIIRGHRSPSALRPWLAPDVLAQLTRRAELAKRLADGPRRSPGTGLRLGGVRVCVVTDRAVEASVVVREPHRARALALRLELQRGRWKVTALEIG